MKTRHQFLLAALCGFVWAPEVSAQDSVHHVPFRVMSYNVRQVNAADTGAYTWTNRSPNVIGLITDNDPDIFGVQEASAAAIQNDLKAAFDATYDYYQPPGGSPKMIFFRLERFERDPAAAEVEGNIRYDNPYAEGDPCFPNANARTTAWIKLRDKVSGISYFVANLHIAHGNCNLAREQAVEDLRDFIAANAEGRPVVVFGDFNSDPQRAGADDDTVKIVEETRDGLRLYRSARHSGYTNASTYTFNSAWKAPSTSYSRIDYIFVGGLGMATYRQSVDRSEIGGISPSDHFPVLATVRQAFIQAGRTEDLHGDGGVPGTEFAFADVDGDARADKISWNPDIAGGAARVHLGDGTGAFSDSIVSASGARGPRFWFADVDGDNCADELSSTALALSDCAGNFAPSVPLEEGTVGWGDVDGDGCADRIAWDPTEGGGQLRVALSNCDTTFQAEVATEPASTRPDANFYFADVTGDGNDDAIVWETEVESGRTRVYASNGDATFALSSVPSGGSSGVKESRFVFGDFDADGHADKFFWRYSFREGFAQLYTGTAEGFDGHPTINNPGYSASATSRYFLADIDGNGSADMVRWNPAANDGRTYVYLSFYAADIPVVPEPEPEEPDPDEPGDSEIIDEPGLPEVGDEPVDPADEEKDVDEFPADAEIEGKSDCGGFAPLPLLLLLGPRLRRRRRVAAH